MEHILEIQNISKKYNLWNTGLPYQSLRESIYSSFNFTRKRTVKKENFWALKDVSFKVAPGDTIGIIGKNGAGKSTLLKILSKITPPTKGKIIKRGRIASLLEVGTGFHPELSGYENIMLNGSILGMKRKEILSKLDEIIDFSGIQKFLNTPLKHYSSGMQLRLAFAVAAFLEPEILLIDEVLAVGDSEFQKKCINKMKNISISGRTILFVSHDLNAVQALCKKAVHLKEGEVMNIAPVDQIISEYLFQQSVNNFWEQKKSLENPHFSFVSATLKGNQPILTLVVEFKIKTINKMPLSFVAFNISNKMGTPIGQAIPVEEPFVSVHENEEVSFLTEIELKNFIPDDYYLSAWIGPHFNQTYNWERDCISFTIIKSPQESRTFPHSSNNGNIVLNSRIISQS